MIMDALHQRIGAITDAHQAYGYIVLSHDVTPLPEAGRTEAWPDRPVPVQTRRWSGAIPPSGGLSAPSPAIPAPCVCPAFAAADHPRARDAGRSEEHTSELQSLMRISYAVFCLKK